jgi:uncharacterized FlgJ-related protein
MDADFAILKKACNSKFSDIEDAVQYYIATQNENMDYFITRNIKDFKADDSQLAVLTPAHFLKLFKQNS